MSKFVPPSITDCIAAIAIGSKATSESTLGKLDNFYFKAKDAHHGSKAELSNDVLKALLPDPALFEKMGKPKRSEWLAEHREMGQTFIQFSRAVRNRPDRRHNTIYIVPLTFFEQAVPDEVIDLLQRYAAIFFQMKVKVLKSATFAGRVRSRVHYGRQQVHAGNVLEEMREILPGDAFCMGGITLCDLYPKDDWNFVFGLASLGTRCGVYSIARYLPTFDQPEAEKDVSSISTAELLELACPLMTHEMCHMFGMKHCIYFNCLMNGSNHLDESRKRSRFLCPVCLRKLYLACGFDIAERYKQMLDFCCEVSMKKQEEWLQIRMQQLMAS